PKSTTHSPSLHDALPFCKEHSIKPGNIVGAIANEADLDSKFIGAIYIYDDYTTVDLPKGMPKDVLQILKKARVAGRPMNLELFDASKAEKPAYAKAAPRPPREHSDKKSFEKKFSKKDGFKKDAFKKDVKKDGFKKKPRSKA